MGCGCGCERGDGCWRLCVWEEGGSGYGCGAVWVWVWMSGVVVGVDVGGNYTTFPIFIRFHIYSAGIMCYHCITYTGCPKNTYPHFKRLFHGIKNTNI